jgi:DNA helicase-2/ATP-dependent DNA helicase PcrA
MILDQLNEMQRQAVLMLDKPLCILAGAGTGKTRVITHRIAHLVEQEGAWPQSIMGVTFTNRAAQEMRERISRLLPNGGNRVQLGTFHGIGARWLRRLGNFVGVPPTFLIYDQDDAERLKKQVANQLHIAKDALEPYVNCIEVWQNQGLTPAEVLGSDDPVERQARDFYRLYVDKLNSAGALDFNSILLKWKELLFHEEAFAIFGREIRHFLVDEYQDTNVVQAQIVHRIAQIVRTLAVVGDDDQSIYGWRGANANHLQKFLKEIPDAVLIKLEHNYRSTKNILEAANQVIAHNSGRIGKSLFTTAQQGDAVNVLRSRSDRAEAERIIDMIRLETHRGLSASSFAILMRTNGQSRLFEEALRKNRMPFKLIGGMKFYDRKEIKDALATLRAALNPKSDIDFLRAIHAISRGVGDASLEKVRQLAGDREMAIQELCQSRELLAACGLSKRALSSLLSFSDQLKVLREMSLNLDAEEAVVEAIQISGLGEKLSLSDSAEDSDRLENLNQLVVSARNFVEQAQKENQFGDSLSFLEASALMSSSDELLSEQEALYGSVTLMTLHAAKGLEFDHVFMVGLEEYGFPHARALAHDADDNELEEERRLAYVGMTRARLRLFLSHADQRLVFGTVKSRMPSRFLKEFTGVHKAERRVELDEEYATGAVQNALKKGMRVTHASLGRGTVVEARGAGALARAVVRFDRDRSERAIVATHLQELG